LGVPALRHGHGRIRPGEDSPRRQAGSTCGGFGWTDLAVSGESLARGFLSSPIVSGENNCRTSRSCSSMMLLLIPSPGVGTRSRSLPLRPQRRQGSPSCQDDAPPRARRLGCRERLPPEPSPLFLLHANNLKATTTRYTLPLRCRLATVVHFPLRGSTVSGRQTKLDL